MTPPSLAGLGRRKPIRATAAEVARGVLRVTLPLPFALNHVNAWLLEDGDGWTLVDTGVSDDATRAAWEGLAPVLRGRPIRRVVCTHWHPDHVGLAAWLCERSGAELACSPIEWLHARMWTLEPPAAAEAAAAGFYRRAGVPEAAIAPLAAVARIYGAVVAPPPATFHGLRDGDALRVGDDAWEVVVGRGHSPGHVCLYDRANGIFLAGDQVLPAITPNVSVELSEPDADPLADFLETLDRLERLADQVLVLPSHGRPFLGLHGRVLELEAHHRQRLAEVEAACEEPRTAFEIMARMFPRELDPHQATFAVGESISHLNHLVRAGRLRRRHSEGEPDRWERVPRRR